MYRWLIFLLIFFSLHNASASKSVQRRVAINAELALNTCTLSLSPANLNFQKISLNQFENNDDNATDSRFEYLLQLASNGDFNKVCTSCWHFCEQRQSDENGLNRRWACVVLEKFSQHGFYVARF